MLKLHDDGIKRDIQSACRSVKPSDIYANDDLTPLCANQLYLPRRAKRKANSKIVACGSSNGNIYAFIKCPKESAGSQKVYIKSMDRLESLCYLELGIPLRELREGVTGE